VHYLKGITRPTLIINALDDPFMTREVIPDLNKLSEYVTLEVSETGGHVGFISGGTPWRPQYYLPERILEFLRPNAAMPGL
jgi:predicted alpha/beta-fold hydrolase